MRAFKNIIIDWRVGELTQYAQKFFKIRGPINQIWYGFYCTNPDNPSHKKVIIVFKLDTFTHKIVVKEVATICLIDKGEAKALDASILQNHVQKSQL